MACCGQWPAVASGTPCMLKTVVEKTQTLTGRENAQAALEFERRLCHARFVLGQPTFTTLLTMFLLFSICVVTVTLSPTLKASGLTVFSSI